MAKVRIKGDTSGHYDLTVPDVAGDNDVSLADLATLSGLLSGDDLSVAGDLAVDTDTLKVDATNDRVGINQASPTEALDVSGTVKATSFSGDGSALTNIDLGIKVVKSSEISYDNMGTYLEQVAHGQSTAPDHVFLQLHVKADEDGYTAGDVITIGTLFELDETDYVLNAFGNATNMGVAYNNKAAGLRIAALGPSSGSTSYGSLSNAAHRYVIVGVWYS